MIREAMAATVPVVLKLGDSGASAVPVTPHRPGVHNATTLRDIETLEDNPWGHGPDRVRHPPAVVAGASRASIVRPSPKS
jgi:hypothetical protein